MSTVKMKVILICEKIKRPQTIGFLYDLHKLWYVVLGKEGSLSNTELSATPLAGGCSENTVCRI